MPGKSNTTNLSYKVDYKIPTQFLYDSIPESESVIEIEYKLVDKNFIILNIKSSCRAFFTVRQTSFLESLILEAAEKDYLLQAAGNGNHYWEAEKEFYQNASTFKSK